MAHAQANAGIKNALKGGVATIEHGIWLDGDAIEMMLDGGNALIPTLVAPQGVRHAEAGTRPATRRTRLAPSSWTTDTSAGDQPGSRSFERTPGGPHNQRRRVPLMHRSAWSL
jgi:imidazolonepropionase-like amidohydrolase